MPILSGKVLLQLSGLSLIVSCVGFIAWLVSYAVFLPVNADNSNYAALVSSPHWVWVNLIQQVAIMTGLLGTVGLVSGSIERLQWLGLGGLVLAVTGYVFMAGLSFTETFAWSTLAQLLGPAKITEVAGSILKTPPFSVGGVMGFYLFSAGYLLIGLSILLNSTSPKWMASCVMLGSVLFSVSFLLGALRYKLMPIALLLFVGGLIPLGIELLR